MAALEVEVGLAIALFITCWERYALRTVAETEAGKTA